MSDFFPLKPLVKFLIQFTWFSISPWLFRFITWYVLFLEKEPMQLLLNVGGPDRVSRVQMAEAVAHIRGYNLSLIKSVSSSTVSNIGLTLHWHLHARAQTNFQKKSLYLLASVVSSCLNGKIHDISICFHCRYLSLLCYTTSTTKSKKVSSLLFFSLKPHT